MTEKEILKDIHDETMFFFENILTSESLQDKYDLINYNNRDYVLSVIKNFKDSKTAFIVKPFYENDYYDSPRSLIVKRDKYGFLITKLNDKNSEPSIIEPFRFVSIIKQLIEDENIKKEKYSKKEKTTDINFEFFK